MADRKQLQDELNRINELYQQTDLEMRKAGGSTEQRQMLRDLLNKKKESLMAELGDDLQKLNVGKGINVGSGTVSKALDQSGLPDVAKQPDLGKFGKTLGKKVAGIIPLAGVGMAALSGDPAMAAEELAEDAVGPLAALKPDIAGNPQEEKMMLAERKALENYKKSQAYRDARGITEEDQDIEELQKPKKTPFSRLRGLFGD